MGGGLGRQDGSQTYGEGSCAFYVTFPRVLYGMSKMARKPCSGYIGGFRTGRHLLSLLSISRRSTWANSGRDGSKWGVEPRLHQTLPSRSGALVASTPPAAARGGTGRPNLASIPVRIVHDKDNILAYTGCG
ncbi:unnamed protein product [Linum trigynum]|uniref:Uncharacterized protein n=1 Tax=Linum trigynum TaxID=586398 RepID=A0AAV2FAI0_9ROSI